MVRLITTKERKEISLNHCNITKIVCIKIFSMWKMQSLVEHSVFLHLLRFLQYSDLMTIFRSCKSNSSAMQTKNVYSMIVFLLDEQHKSDIEKLPDRMKPHNTFQLLNILQLCNDFNNSQYSCQFHRGIRITIDSRTCINTMTHSHALPKYCNFRLVKNVKSTKEIILSPVNLYGNTIGKQVVIKQDYDSDEEQSLLFPHRKIYFDSEGEVSYTKTDFSFKLIAGISLYVGGPAIRSTSDTLLRYKTLPIWQVKRKPEIDMIFTCIKTIHNERFVITEIKDDRAFVAVQIKDRILYENPVYFTLIDKTQTIYTKEITDPRDQLYRKVTYQDHEKLTGSCEVIRIGSW